ncbi:hypothetical protein M758_3G237200 [Ceratodon purpureus]|nr:hypothetical protein M758_3G237200 [Ceratodon purpureus]
MASLTGAVPDENANSLGRSISYHRTGSSSRASIVNVPMEHVQTVQSGIQADWPTHYPPSQPTWITRNDSTKAYYDGSDANVALKKRVKRGVGLSDARKADVWKAAAVELVATTGLTFLSITVYLQGSKASVAALAFLQALIYSLAILAAAPTSGGHLNPAITFTTFITGQATLIRSLLYIVAQLLGGIIGAGGVRLLINNEARTSHSMGGCLLQAFPVEGTATASAASTLSNNQGLLAEMVFTIIMLFVVYGIGFDTRSIVVTFPIITPFIIGGVFGILVFVSQGLGYTAAMNPARCFGPAVIYGKNLWDPLYAFIMGPLMGAVLFGIFQILVHPTHGAEFGPVLPLNFFQTVTPDHRRSGYGPRGPGVYNCPIGGISHDQAPDQDVFHSQRLIAHSPPPLSNFPATTSSVLQVPTTTELPGASPSNSKFNLTLQIKAIMQPTGSDGYHGSAVNIIDATRPADQDLTLHQHSSLPTSPGGAAQHQPGDSDPYKDR